MKHQDMIKSVKLKQGINEIDLGYIYPISPIEDSNLDVSYFIDDEKQSMMIDCFYANHLVVIAHQDGDLNIQLGKGYYVEKNDTLTQKFVSRNKWSGGDGIYSFNLTNGNDQFDQKDDIKTLFVFGDTFVGRSDEKTYQRFQPHLMPNNSIAYKVKDHIDFKLNWQENGEIAAFYQMDKVFDESGSIAQNLVTYNQKDDVDPYLSGYHPNHLEIVFDLHKPQAITHMHIYNYFSKESDELAKRGLKNIVILGSNDQKDYKKIKEYTLKMSTSINDFDVIQIEETYRYIKLSVETKTKDSNYNDQTFDEGLFGLNKVKFFNDTKQYRDIKASSNNILLKDYDHSWIWLQDGVVIKDQLYFIPMVVNSDSTQPEGLQFKIKGVSMFKTPIENNQIVPHKRMQKMAPILVYDKDSEYLYGGAIMPNSTQANPNTGDGYIYVYGYKTTMGLREMIVARVKEEVFEYVDEWTYFDGEKFQHDILKSAPLLKHISCEFSVSIINEGLYKGKYLAVFTYDVNTPYVSYAIGETPVGPFSKPQKIYKTPEPEIYKSTTYTYNAKAHPHLSSSKKVLVSYNTNTYNFDHNMSNSNIYRPRFIYLNDTTK
ncbi:hypothetical protein BK010_04605 [Tenericutes bacterium MO-XQ]|nr:hypothetical protein BK010_04605 [Tenericutes bacterium MO-XQ]